MFRKVFNKELNAIVNECDINITLSDEEAENFFKFQDQETLKLLLETQLEHEKYEAAHIINKYIKMTTTEQFNEKYKDYLEKGHYGLALNSPKVIDYLDKEFQELIKIPDFKYTQIKSKFNFICCYMQNEPIGKREEIEKHLKELVFATPTNE